MGDVNLEHITKRYGDVTAVDDVSIDIEDGEFVTLVGPSGCGKSTTLETIAGLTTPTEGEVHIAGRDVTDLPPKDRQISMVFQNIALFPHMDVYDNISYGLRLRDFEEDEVDRRVDDAAEIVQMEGMLDRMPDELSGGQRQRVAIGRAIVREPEVFLMDEPLANLDAALRVHMRTELQRLHRELDTTIVYVTHDQEEAMTMSNRLAIMNEGRVQQFAEPLECYGQPANEFVAGFIGSPSMNMYDATITGDGLETSFFEIPFDPERFGLSAGREVTFGIRPEDVALSDSNQELGDPTEPIVAETDVVEPIGDEVFVYLLLAERSDHGRTLSEGDDELLLSTPPDRALTEWEEERSVRIRFDRRNVHLFDAESGESILHDLGEPEQAEADDPGPEPEPRDGAVGRERDATTEQR